MHAGPSSSVLPPHGWLALAVLGAMGYLAAALLQLTLTLAHEFTRVSSSTLQADLPLAATASSFVIFAGLVGALSRANRAAGPSGGGQAERALGTLVLGLAGVVLPIALRDAPTTVPAVAATDGATAVLVGTVLAFLGLAALTAGLVRTPASYGRQAALPNGGRRRDEADEGAESVTTDLLEGL